MNIWKKEREYMYSNGNWITGFSATSEEQKLFFSITSNCDGTVALGFTNSDTILNAKLNKQLIDCVSDKCFDINYGMNSICTKNQTELYNYINVIDKNYPFYNHIESIMLAGFFENAITITKSIDNGKIWESLSDAGGTKFDFILMFFAQYCESKKKWHDALACYDKFDKNSHYYNWAKNQKSKIISILEKEMVRNPTGKLTDLIRFNFFKKWKFTDIDNLEEEQKLEEVPDKNILCEYVVASQHYNIAITSEEYKVIFGYSVNPKDDEMDEATVLKLR